MLVDGLTKVINIIALVAFATSTVWKPLPSKRKALAAAVALTRPTAAEGVEIAGRVEGQLALHVDTASVCSLFGIAVLLVCLIIWLITRRANKKTR